MVRHFVAAFGVAFALSACTPAQAQPAAASASSHQTVVPIAPASYAAIASTFVQENPGWVTPPPLRPRFSPTLLRAQRPALGPTRRVLETEAVTLARVFLSKNSRHLGLGVAEAASLPIIVVHPRPDIPDAPWSVVFGGYLPRPGYEGLVDRRIDVTVAIGRDGAPSELVHASDPHVLTFRTAPRLAAGDPAVVAGIVGQPKYRYEDAGRESDYSRFYRRVPNGTIQQRDIRSTRRSVHVTSTDQSVTYVLAYEVTVEDAPGSTLRYVVDADTGAVLYAPAPPGKLVP